ncbi:PREDICTED: ubiquitin carboxyl-terminal hydrolase 35-like [Papilio polytes]|uniref:ubiquitin carboxyl-terminal hydrolase 35-like n=1 Tax=Papilio polytes TaxID=76194 RepID=UPI00067671B9|nr:PREDICTED: ubiquitin carboxyl-terminal hydrolase 35-like [Papilio polytes]
MEEVKKDANVDVWMANVPASHEFRVMTQDNSRKPKLAEKSLLRHSSTENPEKYVKYVNTNKPSTSEEVPLKRVPLALFCSVQKLFPTVQLNTLDEGKYPKTTYRFTPIVKDEDNDNIDNSLSQISLGNTSTSDVSPKQNVTSAGTVGSYTSYQGRTAYPARNTGNINIENTFFIPIGQYHRIGNDNRRIGLKNTGSSCYINCVMQVLLATHKFSTFTVTKMFLYPYWAELAELFGSMMFTVHPVINPKKYYTGLSSLYFNIFQEHDVSEFFLYLIELLRSFEPNWDRDWSDEARSSTSSEVRDRAVAGCSYQAPEAKTKQRPKIIGFDESRKFFVNNMFGGVVATSVRCDVCSNISNRYELVYMLHLSIPDMMCDEVLTTQMLLDNHFTSETLSGANSYMCNTCRCQQNAQKSTIVVYTPKHLILTLKNFSYDPKLRASSKKNSKIRCEETITLHSSTKQKDRNIYVLYAVIVHHGQSLRTGHYTALTKYRNQWYMINDSEINTINFNDMNRLKNNETPYMLFYRRADIKEGSFPEYDKIPWFSRYAENQPDGSSNK